MIILLAPGAATKTLGAAYIPLNSAAVTATEAYKSTLSTLNPESPIVPTVSVAAVKLPIVNPDPAVDATVESALSEAALDPAVPNAALKGEDTQVVASTPK